MDGKAIEEAFNHKHIADLGGARPVEIEEHLRFPEASGKPVLRFFVTEGATVSGGGGEAADLRTGFG
jgi:hypothetical protein